CASTTVPGTSLDVW
nr:immunoglobulin heavy chain junction region [Macaca mulatta]MOW46309.1 immunoglobulin heavy chain junction region [Macaca mulatta]